MREDDEQWLIEVTSNAEETPGTQVFMEILLSTNCTTKTVFDKYVDDEYRFAKTHVPIMLAKIGEDQLVSRSQAKRVLARAEEFSEVILDFSGIHNVGQAFADEIFRVFAKQHPEVQIVTFNVPPDVQGMIEHVTNEGSSSEVQERLP